MLGLTVPEVLDLEEGSLPIDGLLAERLEYVFGVSEAIWMGMEVNYQKDLERLAKKVG
jgi:plasmid maintenance system antidote protein VapI